MLKIQILFKVSSLVIYSMTIAGVLLNMKVDRHLEADYFRVPQLWS